jgi:hypothetical protein
MSFNIIAPSILAGLPIPVPVEIKEPTDFMKFMVKHYHAAREIDKLNFFLNTQEPGLIFDSVGGGRNGRTRYAGWANSYNSNGRNKLRVHARSVPSYIYDVRDPLFSSIPYPFGVPVLGAPLFGTSGDKFGVQSVVGPNGLIIPVKQSQPIGTDGKPLNSGLIMPFGGPMMGRNMIGRPMIGNHMMGPIIGGPMIGNPMIGGPMIGVPGMGMMGLRISPRNGTKNETELFRDNMGAIENFIEKVKIMHDELNKAYAPKNKTPDITNRIQLFETTLNKIRTDKQTAISTSAGQSNAGTLSEPFVKTAKEDHDKVIALYTNLLTDINGLAVV